MRDQPSAADPVDRRPSLVLRLESRLQQRHPDDPVIVQRVTHHLAIARLEDVERQVDARKQHGVRQREEGKGGWEHIDCGLTKDVSPTNDAQCTVLVFFSK